MTTETRYGSIRAYAIEDGLFRWTRLATQDGIPHVGPHCEYPLQPTDEIEEIEGNAWPEVRIWVEPITGNRYALKA
jgi:hypothetical protein